MREAYERELALTPILLENEREGIHIADRRLARDLALAEADLETTDRWLRRELRAKDLNLDSNNDLADALEHAGKVKRWIATPTGERSTSKEDLLEVIEDKALAHVLNYRGRLAHVISSFMRPWNGQAEKTGGIIHTQWHQCRGANDFGGFGARTRSSFLCMAAGWRSSPSSSWSVRGKRAP
jgi:DNA polymerase I-like protein with 3'-5' exonuclease and polymerase domains